jgi:hypothetical protein
MAIAAPAGPAAPSAAAGTRFRRWGIALAVIVGVAVVLKLAYGPWYMNYDTRYALLWAHDLWHGFSPEYTADFAPTPHPLLTAAASLALPFGNASDEIITWAILLAFGTVVWLSYRLGETLFHPAVGVVAALVVATRPATERDALLGYQDVPFAAFILGAVLLEAQRRRRGLPVLGLLALAGLLRPEAWVLSGLYVLWLWRGTTNRSRALMIVLAASAPVIWALSDLAVTGDLLHSLHGTAALAEDNDRRRYVNQIPYWTAQYFGYTLREPLVVGVPVGLVFAWLYVRKRALLPFAVALAMTAVFAVGPVFGLPLIGRYVRTPSDLLAVFYGLAVCGWVLLPAAHPARRTWQVIGVVAALLSVAFLPWHVRMLRNLERGNAIDSARYAQLRDVARAPAVRAAFAACPDLSAADHRPIPYIRFWLRGAPGTVSTVRGNASPLGKLLLVPRRNRLQKRIYGTDYPPVSAPAGWTRVYQNPSWRVLAAPGCA